MTIPGIDDADPLAISELFTLNSFLEGSVVFGGECVWSLAESMTGGGDMLEGGEM